MKKKQLSGLAFAKLFHQKFNQSVLNLGTLNTTPQYLDTDAGLYLTTLEAVSYYLGYHDRNTVMYKGKISSVNKITKILLSPKLQTLLYDAQIKEEKDWDARLRCLNVLKLI